MSDNLNRHAGRDPGQLAAGLFSALRDVERPSRYVGGEANAEKKPWGDAAVRVALTFPDTYEIGISNMGLQILYRTINGREDALAERSYAPWPDYEQALRRRGLPLVSLESKRSLGDFDLLGIAIPYELTFTNILTIIDLAGLPLRSADRDARHPLVIGGGAAVYNPEPVAPFFDAFVIGDGEEVIHELIDCVKALKAADADRSEQLAVLARIPGLYVPSLYDVRHHPDGRVAEIAHADGAPPTVTRRVVADLDGAFYPTDPVLPTARAVFDRVNVEVTRGCTHGCRFCQAGFTYRPVRERSPERVRELVLDSLKRTGYDEVTLSSLSTGDYLCLYPLMRDLVDATCENKVAFSLPSLRIGTLTPAVVRQIKRVTKTGFTMAPEAGSERLRRVINKPVSEDDLLAAVHNVFAEGWGEIKFYFMYGLPTEEMADLDGIVSLADAALTAGRRVGGRPRGIKVSTSVYVPKPMTPFQWVGQMAGDELDRRRRYLLDGIRGVRGARFTWKDERVSRLEAIFSRGDRRLADAVELAWRRGVRMDAWEEMTDTAAWEEVFAATGLDGDFYARRDIPTEEILPWDMIDCGTEKKYFADDLARSLREGIVKDCRYGLCSVCGVCTDPASGPLVVPRVYVPEGERGDEFNLPLTEDTHNHPLVPEIRAAEEPQVPEAARSARVTWRIGWSKEGEMAFVSHLEIIGVFTRAFRRAGIDVALSEGKRPRPRFSFGPALALGVESACEVLDVVLTRPVDPGRMRERLAAVLPDGIGVTGVTPVTAESRSLSLEGLVYTYRISWPGRDSGEVPEDLEKRVTAFLERSSIMIERVDKKGRPRPLEIRPLIESLVAAGGALALTCVSDGNRVPKVLEVLSALGLTPQEVTAARIRRTAIDFDEDGARYRLTDPDRKAPLTDLTKENNQTCLQKY